MIFLILYISGYLKIKEEQSQLIWGFQNTGIIAELGLILIGIFPLDRAMTVAYFIHFVAAVIFFIFLAISNLYLGYIEYKNSEFSKIMAIVSFTVTAWPQAMFMTSPAVCLALAANKLASTTLST